jgi:hypothetical protein
MRPLPDTPGASDVVHRDEVQTMARGGGGQVLARRSGRARKVMRKVRFPSSLELVCLRACVCIQASTPVMLSPRVTLSLIMSITLIWH